MQLLVLDPLKQPTKKLFPKILGQFLEKLWVMLPSKRLTKCLMQPREGINTKMFSENNFKLHRQLLLCFENKSALRTFSSFIDGSYCALRTKKIFESIFKVLRGLFLIRKNKTSLKASRRLSEAFCHFHGTFIALNQQKASESLLEGRCRHCSSRRQLQLLELLRLDYIFIFILFKGRFWPLILWSFGILL